METSLYSKYCMFLLHISLLRIASSVCSIPQPPSPFHTHRIAPSSVAKCRFAYSFLIAHQLVGVIRLDSVYIFFKLIGQRLCFCEFLPLLSFSLSSQVKIYFYALILAYDQVFIIKTSPVMCWADTLKGADTLLPHTFTYA